MEHDSDPLCTDSQNLAPLHLAAINMHLEIFNYLLSVAIGHRSPKTLQV